MVTFFVLTFPLNTRQIICPEDWLEPNDELVDAMPALSEVGLLVHKHSPDWFVLSSRLSSSMGSAIPMTWKSSSIHRLDIDSFRSDKYAVFGAGMNRLMLLCLGMLACQDEPDLSKVLQEFAQANATNVYDGIYDDVEKEEGLNLWDHDDIGTFSGQLSLSEGVTIDWSLEYTWPNGEDEGERHWDWIFAADYDTFGLASGAIAGSGDWEVNHGWYDIDYADHSFDGQLILDDGDSMDVDYEAYFSGNLHWVEGTIDGVEVDWEHSNPDLP